MIVRIADALEKRCVNKTGNCETTDCMAWEYYVPPVVSMSEKSVHGIRDRDKLGYCGLVHRR
jgi:hypothetical protein